ncbi:hypothetical protein GCM10010521_38590 [Streptomyces rameus]|uniref:dTMP kinase n=1 Tax=Streptomyces rameus TaxID=68261 RepID=A0ABP6NGF0_9ACTN
MSPAAARGADETVATPVVSPDAQAPGAAGHRPDGRTTEPRNTRSTDDTTVLRPVREERGGFAPDAQGFRSDPEGFHPDPEVTTELPQPPVATGPAEETAVLPRVPAGAADETAVLPQVSAGGTAEAPRVPVGAADETAVLPPVRDGDPADRVPSGYFRDERPAAGPDGSEPRTREMPQVDADGTPRRRPRSDWAEETPLDDLPTLADELLGSYDEPERGDQGGDQGGGEEQQGRRGRGRRG